MHQRTMTSCAIRSHFAEFAISLWARAGKEDGLADLLEDEDLTYLAIPGALAVLVNQLKKCVRQVDAIERKLTHIQKASPTAKLLSSISGISP
ncbi:hypothetical protein ABIB82_007822 [Bradyrhizobium sp. i1.8.4]|uniref:hypothetical protein n=1 Tax=unclassified Bradyrhizobium TaxID=2631580 RepID=UPI003D1B2768